MLCALTTQRSNSFHAYDKLPHDVFCPGCVFVSQSCWRYFCRQFFTPQKIKLPVNTAFQTILRFVLFGLSYVSQKVSPRKMSQRTTVPKTKSQVRFVNAAVEFPNLLCTLPTLTRRINGSPLRDGACGGMCCVAYVTEIITELVLHEIVPYRCKDKPDYADNWINY